MFKVMEVPARITWEIRLYLSVSGSWAAIL
jgi:hypothetical protein